jgi:hypothetical protein
MGGITFETYVSNFQIYAKSLMMLKDNEKFTYGCNHEKCIMEDGRRCIECIHYLENIGSDACSGCIDGSSYEENKNGCS